MNSIEYTFKLPSAFVYGAQNNNIVKFIVKDDILNKSFDFTSEGKILIPKLIKCVVIN